MKVFEEYLLDADWSLNAANWMWLSASAFFHQVSWLFNRLFLLLLAFAKPVSGMLFSCFSGV